jgi:dolichyl-phosphate beta-glucosyltransferase
MIGRNGSEEARRMPKSARLFLSIIVPAYNEEARLGETLKRIRGYLDSHPYASEIIVVDDGSTDRTREIAAESLRGRPGDRLLSRDVNRGKGASVKEGVAAAAGELILFTDADLSTPIEELDKMLPEIDGGADIVIGSRALNASDIQIRQNRFRELMGKTFNIFVRTCVLDGIRDTQCGFKLFKREAARAVFPSLSTCGFCFDVEALYLGRRLGLRIAQTPVIWRNSPQSKVRIFRSSARMIWDLFGIRRRHRQAGKRDKASPPPPAPETGKS